jgi:ABC-type oligopeptide transport system substrate-binding subunit
MKRRERLITVCSACLCASCWHMVFPCSDYRTAGTVQKTATQLRRHGREHPDYFSRKEVERHCGGSDWMEAA